MLCQRDLYGFVIPGFLLDFFRLLFSDHKYLYVRIRIRHLP